MKKNGKRENVILFSNPGILEESVDEEPFEYQKTEIARINNSIEQMIKQNKPNIVAYLGPYGSGKSVVLDNVLKGLPENYRKMQFDVWQCSDSRDIWENFLIQFLASIEKKEPNKILCGVDGTKIKWRWLLLFLAIYIVISGVFWFIFKEPQNWFMLFMKAFLIYAAPIFLVLAGINKFFPVYESKINTLFQYKERIIKEIRKNKSPIIIVIEDIDRSGDTGYQFLEVLKCFLKEVGKYPIVILCPQKNLSFGSVEFDRDDYWTSTDRLERSIKLYDDVLYGTFSKNVSWKQAKQLLDRAGCSDQKLVDTIGLLINTCSSNSLFTMRSLKFLLRNTASFIESDTTAEPALVFFYLSYKFLDSKKGVGSSTMVKEILNRGVSLTSNPNTLEIDLVCRLFDIDLNMYSGATRIQFGDLDVSYGVLNYRCHRHINNKNWIECDVNQKYKILSKSIAG